VFARLLFGEWSRTLANQAGRGHQLFVVDDDEQVLGYLGWALTHEPLAKQWLQGQSPLTDDQCRGGDCVLINAWAADSGQAERLLLAAAREIVQEPTRCPLSQIARHRSGPALEKNDATKSCGAA